MAKKKPLQAALLKIKKLVDDALKQHAAKAKKKKSKSKSNKDKP